jgi:hypothetical protein
MFGMVLGAAVLLAGPPDDLTLHAEVRDSGGLLYEFASTPTRENGVMPRYVVTDVLTNHHVGEEYTFTVGKDVRGAIRQAGKRDGKVVPQSVTLVWTSYRGLTEGDGPVALFTVNGDESAFSANRWVESNGAAGAYPGRTLEAKLIEGGANGTVLAWCKSEVTGDKEKGYTYTYTVENRTEKPVTFKWAGLEGKVEPKKTFSKSEPGKVLSNEESGALTLDWGDKREFAIRANFWARPK